MEVFQPIHNPEIPLEHEIRGMFAGRVIYIHGTPNEDADRFHINLKAGDDTLLHFNPRFPQDVVVRNTNVGGWGSEEREGGMPFKPGQPFDILIICKKDFFRVRVDGMKFIDYNHRGDYKTIDSLNIVGDVSVDRVQFETHKSEWQISKEFPEWANDEELTMPFVNMRQHSVVVVGEPTDATRFAINFMDSEGDILFHFNPRAPGNVIVCNNKKQGAWQNEERHDVYPFHVGTPYMVRFDIDKDKYDVTVNGLNLFTFNHREGRARKIAKVEVKGDTKIHKNILSLNCYCTHPAHTLLSLIILENHNRIPKKLLIIAFFVYIYNKDLAV